MKRNSIVFIDSTAWLAILDENNINYKMAREFYEKLLDQNARLITNNIVIDETLTYYMRIRKGAEAKSVQRLLN